jgi:GT2 family glycosyltransferase
MEKVSVVIPVYGQWNFLKRNVEALLKYDIDYIEEIIVVDDCSIEKNPYNFNSQIVKIIVNDNNRGYAGTVNNGLKQAKSDIIVLLDSDAYPIGEFVQKLLIMYSKDSLIGCVGFSTVNDDGDATGNYVYEPSILGLIAGQKLESKLGFLRFWRKKNILPYSCAVSFRKDCIKELGYLDDKSFPVLEADHDISMRIHRSKWKLIFTDEIIICHQGGISYKVNHKRVVLFHIGRWKLLRKHNMILFIFLSKFLIQLRLEIELIIFKLLAFINKNNNKYEDKIQGREILIKEVKSFQ